MSTAAPPLPQESRLIEAIGELHEYLPTRVITIRLPSCCHRSLLQDARLAHTSMNKLALERLFAGREEWLEACVAAARADEGRGPSSEARERQESRDKSQEPEEEWGIGNVELGIQIPIRTEP